MRLRTLDRAQAKNDEVRSTGTRSRNAVVLLLAGAGVRFDAGRASAALQDYDAALPQLAAADDALEKAQALAGGALCLLEVGQLPAAEQRLRRAMSCLGETSPEDVDADRFRLELDHNLALVRAYRDDCVEALRLLRICRHEAQERGYPLLAARSLDARVVAHLVEGDYREARERAREASAEAAQLGNREFARAAFGSLALTELLLHQQEEAMTAARAALGFGHDRRSWSHWVLRGIALLQDGRVERAHADFSSACRRAQEVLRSEPDDYQVLEHHALALVGLVLCEEPERRPDALASFERARDLTRERGSSASASSGSTPFCAGRTPASGTTSDVLLRVEAVQASLQHDRGVNCVLLVQRRRELLRVEPDLVLRLGPEPVNRPDGLAVDHGGACLLGGCPASQRRNLIDSGP